MNKEKVISEINKILEKNNNTLRVTQKNIDKPLKETGLDSLSMMEMIVEIEEKLKISLPDDELLKLKTANDLVSLIVSETSK